MNSVRGYRVTVKFKDGTKDIVYEYRNEDIADSVVRTYSEHPSVLSVKKEKLEITDLDKMTSKELKKIAKEHKVANWWNLSKANLIKGIEAANAEKTESEENTEIAEPMTEDSIEVNDESKESIEPDTETMKSKTAEPMKMSETVKTLETIFDKLNGIYFNNSLPKAVITVQSTPSTYGHCSTKKIWETDSTVMYEINLGAEFINRPIQNTAVTLCHEMIHLYCLENDIADTSQKGRYHNKNFKNEAEARDLVLTYDRANGYSKTEPSEVFTNKLAEAGIDMTIKLARITLNKPKTQRKKQNKYVCPICGQTVKTTTELNLICGNCEEPMEAV